MVVMDCALLWKDTHEKEQFWISPRVYTNLQEATHQRWTKYQKWRHATPEWKEQNEDIFVEGCTCDVGEIDLWWGVHMAIC
jgi:hypothetical protein